MGTHSKTSKTFALAVALVATAACALAQSSLLEAPTPVTGNEIAGRIPALDVGDARLTRHFYTLNARPGDLELTVTATNLEGDIDLFSAVAMRPLAKVTLYGGSDTTVARTVFFRRDETLILRVQARSTNDADGSYRVRFGGTFVASTAPAPDEPAGAPESSSTTPAPGARQNTRGSYRVNSIGARIEEPKTEVAAAPTPAETEPAAAPPKPTTTTRANTARGRAAARRESARREAARRAGTPATTSDAEKTEAAKDAPAERDSSAGEKPRAETPRAGTNRARPNRTRAPRAGAPDRAAATSNATPPADATPPDADASTAGAAAALGLEAPGSRLVLELRDGTSVVREMSEVRRVAVEGRLVIVVLKNGRVERQPLSNVRRMTIEP